MNASRSNLRALLLGGALALLCLAPAVRAATYQVTMGTDDRFHPDILTIVPGDSVYWTNLDFDLHTTTSGGTACTVNGLWNSGDIPRGGPDWGMTFLVDGIYPYFCLHHCEFGMVGTIIVDGGTPVAPRTWAGIKSLYR